MRGLVVLASLVALFAPVAATAQEEASATAIVCREIVERSPEGVAEKFPATVGTLYGFSQIVNVPVKIVHVWIYAGRELDKKEIGSPGPNKRWRTWTQVAIEPKKTGEWRLEVRDSQGKVLATHKFVIE